MNSAAISRSEKLVRFEALRAELDGQRAIHLRSGQMTGMEIPSGWDALDQAGGVIRRGVVSEFTGSAGSGSLVLSVLLEMAVREGMRAGLVDGGCTFEPEDWSDRILGRMLWVMAPDARRAVRAADLLVRDGNLPLLVLDLHGLEDRELRGIPSNTWHRFHRMMEESGAVFAVLTRRPMVEGARVRVLSGSRLIPDDLGLDRHVLAERMRLRVEERGAVRPRSTPCGIAWGEQLKQTG